MSVCLESKNKKASAQISNATFAAFVALGRAFHEDIPEWNGYHDGQFYSADQLNKIADRTKQLFRVVSQIEDVAKQGGGKVF